MGKFQRNECAENSANKEDYGFYDITAWNLPLAFGIDAYLDGRRRGNVNANLSLMNI